MNTPASSAHGAEKYRPCRHILDEADIAVLIFLREIAKFFHGGVQRLRRHHRADGQHQAGHLPPAQGELRGKKQHIHRHYQMDAHVPL